MSSYLWSVLSNVENYEFVIRKAFDLIDVDQSGEISSDEIFGVITSLNSYYETGIHPSEEQLKMAIYIVDEDKSGRISFKELMNLLGKLSRHEFNFEEKKNE
jgi:Ca2+-binding EF-hand superfamily protein